MTRQHDPGNIPWASERIADVWRRTRRQEGMGTIVAVVVIAALVIMALSYIVEPAPQTDSPATTPPATYRAQ
jgi:hypothetical protein